VLIAPLNKKGKMQVANVRVLLTKVGSDVPLKNVTPAEAMVLHSLHSPHNGGLTFGEKHNKIEIVGEALVECDVPDKVEPAKAAVQAVGKAGDASYKPAVAAVPEKVVSFKKGHRARKPSEELRRLRAKYSAKDKKGNLIVDLLFPDKLNPKMPDTFADIDWASLNDNNAEVGDVNYATGNLAQTKL
jgi:hypothetical protein